MKKKSKHLLIFWIIAIPLLIGWFYILELKKQPKILVDVAQKVVHTFPFGDEIDTAAELAAYAIAQDGQEKIFLILLQNNFELRPGGGYIGSFAIIKTLDGDIKEFTVHDTANFDGRIPDTVAVPYPMQETMNISAWKFRDSNYAPHFPTNARHAVTFYRMAGGEETFDAIIAINADLLDAILEITGPISPKGYPGTYESGDALLRLQHQVEKAYKEQGIKKGDRKEVMNAITDEMVKKISKLSLREKLQLPIELIEHLNNKNIQIYFSDPQMQQLVESVYWAGVVNTDWEKDYLMFVDANLASLKTDNYIKRKISYDVDLSKPIPSAIATITYNHTAIKRDWMTNDYQTYLRVYIPDKAWFRGQTGNVTGPVYGEEFGKKYIGFLVHVPLGTQKTVRIEYNLPREIKNIYPYNLLIQKQSGVYDIPVHVTVSGANDMDGEYEFIMNEDVILSEQN